jgi:uncharacterized protein
MTDPCPKLPLLPAALAVLLGGCGGGEAVMPKDKTFADALGSGACFASDGYGEPLIVDWRPEQRGDLEVTMKDGLPVVAYDCKSLRLLADCTVEGSFGFKGTTTKEQVVRLEDGLELGANLPFSAGSMAAQLTQESTLDVALVMVGKRMSTRREASRGDLRGRCQGATHFVRGVTLGAFAMETGTKGRARVASDFFGSTAGYDQRGAKTVKTREGSLDDCRKANPDDAKPPPQCASPLRLQLLPLGASPAAAAADGGAQVAGCPQGFVRAGGKCTKATEKLAYLCSPNDEKDCQKQCDAGDAGSCYNLANKLWKPAGRDRDSKRAMPLFEKACELGDENACNTLGLFHWERGDYGKALSLYKRACDAGESSACGNLGTMFKNGKGVPRSETRAAMFYRQACDAGNPPACGMLAALHEDGRGVPRDGKLALALQTRACEGKFPRGCGDLGVVYREGKNTPKDLTKARDLFQRACDGGDQKGCTNLGQLYESGDGVAKDELKAFSLYLRACETDYPTACIFVGSAYEKGKGVARDQRRSVEYFAKSCEAGNDATCSFLAGKLVRGDGTPKDPKRAAQVSRVACNRDYDTSCQNLTDIADMFFSGEGAPRDYVQAAGFYQSACNKGVARACSKLSYIIEFGKGGIRVDMPQAIKGYALACNRGHANACAMLAVVYWNGKGTARDPARATGLLEQACSKSEPWACLNLAVHAAFGIGRKREPKEAEKLFDTACSRPGNAACERILREECEGGEERACTVLGGLQHAGTGLKRDGLAGVKAMTKGCADGDALACELLKKVGAPVPKTARKPGYEVL